MKAYLYEGGSGWKEIYIRRGFAIDCGRDPRKLTEIELLPTGTDLGHSHYARKTEQGWEMTDRIPTNCYSDPNYVCLYQGSAKECQYPKYLPVFQVNGKSAVKFNAYPDWDGSEYQGDVYPLADQNIKSGMVKVLRLTEDGKAAAIQWHCTAPTDEELLRVLDHRFHGHDINITWCHNDDIGDWVAIGNKRCLPCAFVHGKKEPNRHDELLKCSHTVTEQLSYSSFIIQGYGLAEDWDAYFKTWNQINIPDQFRMQIQPRITVEDCPYQDILQGCGLFFDSIVGIPFLDSFDVEQTIFNIVKQYDNELVEDFRQYFNEVNDSAMQAIRSAVKKGRLSLR